MTTIAPSHTKTAPLEPRVKQASRKGKKAWRRHIDIENEETAMEVMRENQRLGVSTDLQQDELFVVDKQGDEEVRQKEFGTKKLYIDQILQPKSGVPALINPLRKSEPIKQQRKLSAKENAKVSKAAVAQKRKLALSITETMNMTKRKKVVDLWGTDDSTDTLSCKNQSTHVKVPDTMKQIPLAKLVIPAVIPEQSGRSYNPDPKVHQRLLRKAIHAELQNIKREEYLDAIVVSNNQIAEAGEIDIGNMSGSDNDSDVESGTDNERVSYSTPVIAKRLTQTELNKQRRYRKLMGQQAGKRKHKALQKEIAGASAIVAKMEETEKTLKRKHSLRKKTRLLRKLQPGKFGAIRFKPVPIEVQTTDELTNSLRRLKPEGSLLRDRLHSLQRRNIIVPSANKPIKRRYPIKVYEKRDYRDFK